ncbi:myb/SANT-like DNA-binding domain-containing protein 4 [Gigantopelta aegis]|uniref:myb/SANT-like DNA-binding domain-containing protein 4 n=1 Tax=Gigantopelta aegis TaxID=1735272 RepID=UPI001B888C40|nr:myb/SANT-like DNA-binding domain-containing protein 4 [Gigantopelta aegis]
MKGEKRKANFDIREISLIVENVSENIGTIKSKLTNSVTNNLKKQVWQSITDQVNSVGVERSDRDDVKEKRRSMYTSAKKKNAEYKKSLTKTGGGPSSKELSPKTQKIVDLFSDDPSFSGLNGGMETAILINQGSSGCEVIDEHHSPEQTCTFSSWYEPTDIIIQDVSPDDMPLPGCTYEIITNPMQDKSIEENKVNGKKRRISTGMGIE